MAETKSEKGDKAEKGAKPGKAEKPVAKGAKPDAATADAKVANPDAPASSLVNDIVTGGTGSVVQPPPAKP